MDINDFDDKWRRNLVKFENYTQQLLSNFEVEIKILPLASEFKMKTGVAYKKTTRSLFSIASRLMSNLSIEQVHCFWDRYFSEFDKVFAKSL